MDAAREPSLYNSVKAIKVMIWRKCRKDCRPLAVVVGSTLLGCRLGRKEPIYLAENIETSGNQQAPVEIRTDIVDS